MRTMQLTAKMVSMILAMDPSLSSYPGTLLVIFPNKDEKKATSKFSLNAISCKAVIVLLATLLGRGPFGAMPSARCSMARSCCGFGLGNPSVVGGLKSRTIGGSAKAVLASAMAVSRKETMFLEENSVRF